MLQRKNREIKKHNWAGFYNKLVHHRKCDNSATTFKGKWFIMYNKEPSGRVAGEDAGPGVKLC